MLSSRAQAIQSARNFIDNQPVYLDTETNGLDRRSEIVEVCVIDDSGKSLYQSLVKPTSPILPDTSRIHGITNDMVRNAPNWLRVWPEIDQILVGKYIGIYNEDFDLRMMQQTHAKFRLPWRAQVFLHSFCIMKLYAQFYGEWDSRKGGYRYQSLDAAGRQCQIPLKNTHRAYDDCLLAREILHFMAMSESN